MDEKVESITFIDTSVLIDYFRKTNKENAFFYKVAQRYEMLMASLVVQFEILTGTSKKEQVDFWSNIFEDIIGLPFTKTINEKAIEIYHRLKRESKILEFKDLIIGTTALYHNFPLATLNEKHFGRIDGLQLITPSSFT